LKLVDPNVQLQGNPSLLCVFTISANYVTSFAAFWILNNEHGGIHDTILVTGIPLEGSIIACQRAAG
jgi:hypothetical protein